MLYLTWHEGFCPGDTATLSLLQAGDQEHSWDAAEGGHHCLSPGGVYAQEQQCHTLSVPVGFAGSVCAEQPGLVLHLGSVHKHSFLFGINPWNRNNTFLGAGWLSILCRAASMWKVCRMFQSHTAL